VTISVEPRNTHTIIKSRTIVLDSERIYEVSGDLNSEKLSFGIVLRNFETRDFNGVFLCDRNTESTGLVTCPPFIPFYVRGGDIYPWSGEVTCVLKKPTNVDFLHDKNTRLTLRFRAYNPMKVAFCMFLHQRLGKESLWSHLNRDQIQMIYNFVYVKPQDPDDL